MVVAILLAINLILLLWLLKQPAQPEAPMVGGDLKLLSELESRRETLPEPPPEPTEIGRHKPPIQPEAPVPETQPAAPAMVAEVVKPEASAPPQAEPVRDAPIREAPPPVLVDQNPTVSEAVQADTQDKQNAAVVQPEATKPVEQKPPTSYCYLYGPMPDQPAGQSVLGELRSKFPTAQLWQEGQDDKGVFWVLIESAKSDIDSVQLEERLRAAGINDIWRVTRGERRNTISMGVFNQKENADKRVAMAKEKGFEAKVVNKHKEGRGFWV
jgi:hypothetical protein